MPSRMIALRPASINAMIERIAYLARRLSEAGVRKSAGKAWQKAHPYVQWPRYAVSGWPQTRAETRKNLKAFGMLCADALKQSAQTDQTRPARSHRRLECAQSDDFPVLGYGNLPKPSGKAWLCDPLHGYCWSADYFANCDFLAPSIRADVKIPWEFSRLQWLIWFAEAAIGADGEEQFQIKEQLLATLDDWAEANQAGYGVNWTCGMEVAIRATNIAMASAALAHLLSDRELDQICSILRAHQTYLARFPEVSDVPGNHYLTDLMGEVVLHAALDGLASAELECALLHFAHAADDQFENGGCHIERATVYHRLTYDIVAIPFAIALRIQSKSVAILTRVIDRAAAFMAQIADDAGRLPVFGDQDSGFVLWFLESAQQVDARICKADAAAATDLHSFLSALAGTDAFFPRNTRSGSGDRSGFGTISDGSFRATIKTGPIGLEGRAAHDHDDALSVCVSFAGQRLIVDAGCHSYTLDPALRTAFILSSRHNSPIPGTRERHLPQAGSINATMRGAPTAMLTERGDTMLKARLDRTAKMHMEAERSLSIIDGVLEIRDSWRFDAPDQVRMLWLLDPAWQIADMAHEQWVPANGARLLLQSSSATLCAHIDAPENAQLTYSKEQFSPDYGKMANCWSLKIKTPDALQDTMRIRISEPK